jgi:Short C-terminal domain
MLRRRPLMRAAATTAVVAGTATAVSGRVARRQNRRYTQEAEANAYEQQAAYQPPPEPGPAAAPAMSAVEQLTQLAALHDQGVLTDVEFEGEKAKILAG